MTLTAACMQVMEALPDSSLCTAAEPGHQLPVFKLPDVVQLPPPLQAKWLRSECMTMLDLSQPGDAWALRHWQSLVGCLSAVPSLVGLTVALPRYSAEDLPGFPAKWVPHRICQSRGHEGGYAAAVCRSTKVIVKIACSNQMCRCAGSGWVAGCRDSRHET